MSGAAVAGPVRSDRTVLLELYRTRGGVEWKCQEGWKDNASDLDTWFGVRDNGDGRVAILQLEGSWTLVGSWNRFGFYRPAIYVSGPFPSEIHHLDALTTLNLSGNGMTGEFPVEVCQLRSLTALNLANNLLTGSIPPGIKKLVALKTLDVSWNGLTGSIPPGISMLVALETLNVSWNQLKGSIPPGISMLVALETLNVSWNRLDGSIPPGIKKLVALKTLDVSHNFLTGSIPAGIKKLVALKTLDVSDNRLTGSIPPGISMLVALETLNVSRNNLDGRIEFEPSGLVVLETLGIDSRFFADENGYNFSKILKLPFLTTLKIENYTPTGGRLSELSNMRCLTSLEITNRNDGIDTLDIPSDLWTLVNLTTLRLEGTGWSGSLSSEVCRLTAMRELCINDTQLTGSIPSEIGGMSSVTWLDLSNNRLTGFIPSEIGGMSSVTSLNLSNNRLTGSIPSEIGGMSSVTSLRFSGNNLSGSIPSEIGGMSSVTSLNFSSNSLTGSIPSEIGGMSSVTSLKFSSNSLTGSVPVELSNLPDLFRLDISNNKLTSLGEVEDAFKLVQKFNEEQPYLHRMVLSGNPWIMPPEAVAEKGVQAIEAYLTGVRMAKEAGVEPTCLKLLKVVLVGSSQAGKTSLMNSIVLERANATEGSADEVSTIGVDLLRHQIDDTRVEFYDCAGQLDYAGMQQVFLSGRALYLLVWDVAKCDRKQGDELDKVLRVDVMEWLYALHLRAPDSTVILVANKCDLVVGDSLSTVQTVRRRVTELLAEWQDSRGIDGEGGDRLPTLNLLAGMSCVSCRDGCGLKEMIDRVRDQDSTSSTVPPSWKLGMAFIDALRDQTDPLRAVQASLGLRQTDVPCGDSGTSLFVRKETLVQRWLSIHSTLGNARDGPLSKERKAALLDPENAIEGALWVSEFSGQIVCVDGGLGIFLDVELLSKVLNPILDHKLSNRMFHDSNLTDGRDKLVGTGVLCCEFARHLWRGILFESPAAFLGQIERSLLDVLVKLGVAIPLGRVGLTGGTLPDMLVPRWLRGDLREPEHEQLTRLVSTYMEGDGRAVTLSWRFDLAGSPRGLVGRVIASCHMIGEAKKRLCWGAGAVFSSPSVAVGMRRLYLVVIKYTDQVLSVKVVGPLNNDRVWVALRFVASTMVHTSREWPGVLWQGKIECAEHVEDRVNLSTPRELRSGGQLIAATNSGCDCRRDPRTVVGQAVARLGRVVDTGKGDPFQDCRDPEGRPGDPVQERRDSEERPGNSSCGGGYCLEVLQHDAGKLAATLLAASLTLFVAIAALERAPHELLGVSLGLLVVMLIAAVIALCYACRAQTRRPPQHIGDVELAPPLSGTATI